ncbi:MAG TPA: hypothetical protein VMX12_10840, partial [Acidimicrobiia bacterium]|nr:hypothetical protein [Acidimicrobiia bacterium]
MGISFFGPAAAERAEELAAELAQTGLTPADEPDLIATPFAYGRLLAASGDPDVMTAGPEAFAKRIEQAALPKLSATEQATVAMAQRHAGQYVTGLGDRVTANTMRAITGLEGGLTPDQIRDVVRDKVAANRLRKESVAALKRDLGREVKDWTREWYRLALTETNNAIQLGTAAQLEDDHGDPKVSKLPRPDACRACLDLYTEDGTTPRIFRLSELRANGSNVGRPRAQWKATIEAMHPHCACVLVRVPEGMRWEGRELVPDDAAKSHKLHYRTTFQGLPISIENR